MSRDLVDNEVLRRHLKPVLLKSNAPREVAIFDVEFAKWLSALQANASLRESSSQNGVRETTPEPRSNRVGWFFALMTLLLCCLC